MMASIAANSMDCSTPMKLMSGTSPLLIALILLTYIWSHGTQTTSVLMGFSNGNLVGPAFGASVILARTEDIGGETPIEEDNWVAGIEWVESIGADIVTSSLGYYYWYEFSDLDGDTALCTIAADAAVDRGLPVFTSAGNERQNDEWPHITAPADGNGVVAMAAVDLSGDIASFSSPGPTYDGRIKPDVSAQGVNNFVASYYDPSQYHSANGTSFACPLVAGVAALMLERIPSLTPGQIAEALRMTADRSDNPDNDYGWGIIDAFAALNYWGPAIMHVPLGDTEDTVGPYTVLATITDQEPLDPSTLFMYWRVDGGAWTQVPLSDLGDDQFSADIPGLPGGGQVEYYLEAGDVTGIVVQMPHNGPDNAYAFVVGSDVTAPMLFHAPLIDQLPGQWPVPVFAEATDNLGIDRVEMSYSRNGEPMQGPFVLDHVGDDIYELMFPLVSLQVGDEVVYELTAYDTAAIPNEAFSGPHLFYGVSGLGSVMIINDDPFGAPDAAAGNGGGDQPVDVDTSADLIAQWLQEAGYTVGQVESDAINPGDLEGYVAVVYSSGNNTESLGNPTARELVIAWVQGGGRIFLEGGTLTEQCLYNYPLYTEFAEIVLHADEWWGSFIEHANFYHATGREHHYFLNRPHFLPSPYSLPDIGYDFGAAGSTYASEDALAIYRTIYNARSCGVLLYDDNTAPEAGQVVFASFDISYASEADGRHLTENALAYLLAREAPGDGSISGTVNLVDNDDNSGVTVSAGPNNSVVTGPDGAYALLGLHGATYTVTAAKAGYGPEHQTVVLGQDDQLAGVDFTLQPIIEVSYVANPELSIPDNDDEGVSSVITVAEEGDIFDLNIDVNISHPSRGQLIVDLTSPTGTQVTLHNLSGGIADDIVGNWPGTLSVDGPGTLADFLGEDIQGDWTLRVADTVWGAFGGVFHSWGLNLQATTGVISAVPGDEGDNLPSLTQITGNVPNPFNPTTVIAFEVATAGRATLDIFDLRGARVRTLVAAEMPPGRYEMTWDGRDDGSRGMASGVYFCRLQAGGKTDLLKMTLVR